MFGYVIDLSGMRQSLRRAFNAQWRAWGGLAFMALAMVAIQYDEIIAPEVARLSDGWSTTAADFSKRLTSFTL
jgi:hypothetical protein